MHANENALKNSKENFPQLHLVYTVVKAMRVEGKGHAVLFPMPFGGRLEMI